MGKIWFQGYNFFCFILTSNCLLQGKKNLRSSGRWRRLCRVVLWRSRRSWRGAIDELKDGSDDRNAEANEEQRSLRASLDGTVVGQLSAAEGAGNARERDDPLERADGDQTEEDDDENDAQSGAQEIFLEDAGSSDRRDEAANDGRENTEGLASIDQLQQFLATRRRLRACGAAGGLCALLEEGGLDFRRAELVHEPRGRDTGDEERHRGREEDGDREVTVVHLWICLVFLVRDLSC